MRNTVQTACVVGLGFAVFPITAIHHFLNAGFEHGVKVGILLDQDVFAFSLVFAVEIDDGVGGCAAACEVV